MLHFQKQIQTHMNKNKKKGQKKAPKVIKKHCKKCHTTKPLKEFDDSERSADGKKTVCKKCYVPPVRKCDVRCFTCPFGEDILEIPYDERERICTKCEEISKEGLEFKHTTDEIVFEDLEMYEDFMEIGATKRYHDVSFVVELMK